MLAYHRGYDRSEKRKAWRKVWRKRNRERLLARRRELRMKNRERLRNQATAYYHKNRDRLRILGRKSYAKHITQRRIDSKQYSRSKHARRRALEKKAVTNLAGIRKWMVRVHKQETAVCYYCERTIPVADVEFDHIVPLSRGGEHSVRNLCVSCWPCNRSKLARTIQEWERPGQILLGL